MKKIVAFLLVAVVAFGASACKKAEIQNSMKEVKITPQAETEQKEPVLPESAERGYVLVSEGEITQVQQEAYVLPVATLKDTKMDFNGDGTEETLRLAIEEGNLLTLILLDEAGKETGRAELYNILSQTMPLSMETTKVFLKKNDAETTIFFEQYECAGLVSDGSNSVLKGFRISGGKFVNILDTDFMGSSAGEGEFDELNARLSNLGLAPVADYYYGDSQSIADAEDVTVLFEAKSVADAEGFLAEERKRYDGTDNAYDINNIPKIKISFVL